MASGAKAIKKTTIFIVFILFAFCISSNNIVTAAGQVVTQNWAAAAVYYSSPCDETESFRMTEEEFFFYQTRLEDRLEHAYSSYLNNLPELEQKALQSAQKAWQDFFFAYEASLAQLWLAPVKIYFGVPGQERRTILYRDILLLLLINRITDLEDWNSGRLVRMDKNFAQGLATDLADSYKNLQIKMGLCLYVIDEPYRAKISQAQQKFTTFLDSNREFVSLIAHGDDVSIQAEELMQIQKMTYITEIYYQGCVFFRREREE